MRKNSKRYELSDKRIGMTWQSLPEAIQAAREAGATSVQEVFHTYVRRQVTGTARVVVWRSEVV